MRGRIEQDGSRKSRLWLFVYLAPLLWTLYILVGVVLTENIGARLSGPGVPSPYTVFVWISILALAVAFLAWLSLLKATWLKREKAWFLGVLLLPLVSMPLYGWRQGWRKP